MFSSAYDQDCATFSPQGKVLQIDYAMEAVKQGSVSIGLRSDTHTVILGLKRSPHEMAGYQEKVFKLDEHVGLAMSGLIVDGRLLVKMLRSDCLAYKTLYSNEHPIGRLVSKLAVKSQKKTMSVSKRPFGVGLLIAGYDALGPHLFQTSPNAEYFEYLAYAIGAKSQPAKTYLDKNFTAFAKCTKDDLILHGLKALKASEGEIELTFKNVTIGVVGADEPFHTLSESELKEKLLQLHQLQGPEPMVVGN